MAGHMAQYVDCRRAEFKTHAKMSNVVCILVTPALGRLRQAAPWGLLASSRSVRDYLKKQASAHLGNDT